MIPDKLKSRIYHEEPGLVLLHGDCLEILPELEPETVQCCVTSPPYWGLRDYGVDGQLGLEETPEAYTERMTAVFRGVNKAMRPDGTLWLNLGDSYAVTGGKHGTRLDNHTGVGAREVYQQGAAPQKRRTIPLGIKSKDLVGIPWAVAFSLRADGWYLRSDIIWHKPNPMPESVTDRPTKAHEYIFLMAKSAKYYYDYEAIKEVSITQDKRKPYAPGQVDKRGNGHDRGAGKLRNTDGKYRNKRTVWEVEDHNQLIEWLADNHPEVLSEFFTGVKPSVWNVATRAYKGAHFAVFPPELIEPCILAGTKEGDIVLDPFNGSGTTGMVCKRLKRRYIGIELNEEYLKLNAERIGKQGVLL